MIGSTENGSAATKATYVLREWTDRTILDSFKPSTTNSGRQHLKAAIAVVGFVV